MKAKRHPPRLGTARDAPPYFAGRRAELAALNSRLDWLCETSDPSAGLSLIVGVPGVGKTQLCAKFAADAVSRKGGNVLHLAVGTITLSRPVDLIMEIAKALGHERKGRSIADIAAHKAGRSIGIGADVAKVSVGTTFDTPRHVPNLESMLKDSKDKGLWNAWHGRWDKVLVLTVDELQTVDAEGVASLRVLHEGTHGCPILTIGAGLQHLPNVLAKLDDNHGISRVAETFRLGALSTTLAVEAVAGNLQALGHEVPESCVVKLAEASHGFPQHVHGYLAGALDAIARYGDLADGPPLAEALAWGDRARTDYYNSRLEVIPHKTPAMLPVIAKMLELDQDAIGEDEAVAAVDALNGEGRTIVNAAIAHGALTLTNDGTVSFGVPSFRTHMVRALEQHQKRRRLATTTPGHHSTGRQRMAHKHPRRMSSFASGTLKSAATWPRAL